MRVLVYSNWKEAIPQEKKNDLDYVNSVEALYLRKVCAYISYI